MVIKTKSKTSIGRRSASDAGSERSGHVQSVSRAMAILNHIASADDGVTLTQIGNAVGLAP